MQVLTTRAALGGPWAANLRGTVLLFPPSLVLVVLQESTTPYTSWTFPVISALAQFSAGFMPVLVAILVRRGRADPLPLTLCFAVWITTAVIRGVVGGLIAQAVVGVDPDFAGRIAFWVTLAVLWMPVFTYALAQWEHRRMLLGALDVEVAKLGAEIERGERVTGELRHRLVTTVRDAVSPVIDEIRRSLAAIAPEIDPDTLRSISGRIAIVAADAARIVDNTGHARRRHIAESPHVAKTRAMYVTVSSPVVTATLTGLLIAPLTVPLAFRESLADGAEMIVALFTIAATLAIAFEVRKRRPERSHGSGLVYVFTTSALAGLAGSLTLVVLPWASMESLATVLALVLPIGLAMCGASIGSISGVAAANRELAARIDSVRADVTHFATRSDADETLVRQQLAAVLHGPVQGRLSACVMALNFHESSRGELPPERTAFITSAVLDHLEAASADLDALAESPH